MNQRANLVENERVLLGGVETERLENPGHNLDTTILRG